MEYILKTSNLEKSYGRFKVLTKFNMHVPKGSIYGLIGKNGAGKTTLIRIICGLQKPTSGFYTICGVSNKNEKIIKVRKKMGAIIESPALCLDMTAEDNLKEQCKIIGISNFNTLHEILKLVKLDSTDNKIVKNFSLGMKQRLGLAIALVGSPSIIILDEPLNGLDPEGIIELRELILKLNKENGITFIISSHYLDELSKVATCYGFVNNGSIIKEITNEELKNNFKKVFHVEVTNMNECVQYLIKCNINYKIISNKAIEIYEQINISNLIVELSRRNCIVSSFQENSESLENYYLDLLGGNKNV